MKILITGAAGFLGLHLVNSLLEFNHNIFLIDNFMRGMKDNNFDDLISNQNVHFYNLNLTLDDSLEILDKDFDFIIHFAAILGVENVVKDNFKVLNENFLMTKNLLEFANLNKKLKRFIFTSTSEVYGGTLNFHGLKFPTPESTEIILPALNFPRTSYMLSKIYGEALCHASDLPVTIIRPHNIYGPRMGFSHVIPQIMMRASKTEINGDLVIYSPSHKREFCYVKDAIELILLLMKIESKDLLTVNLGNVGEEITMKNLSELILGIMDRRDINIIDGKNTEGSPERRIPDISQLNFLTNKQDRIPLIDGIQKTYLWYKRFID